MPTDKELTSNCTCPPGAKARNMTGHGKDCPCYAEWYRRYAPEDAAAYTQPGPDQVGPVPADPPATVHRGADWVIQDGTAITLASIKAEGQDGGDRDEQP